MRTNTLDIPVLAAEFAAAHPALGLDEFFRRFREDLVLNVFDPVTRGAVEEFPAALGELRDGSRSATDRSRWSAARWVRGWRRACSPTPTCR